MKKILLFVSALAGVLFAGSCQREELAPAGENGVVTFEVGIPENATRVAVVDNGTNINDLVYAVYRTSATSLEDAQVDELDEKNYIDGYNLDVDKLLYNEILIGWPMKILCSEDCRGICNVCGQNLNEGSCNCEDTSLDPRMSVIRDVFKNFKEV